MSRVTPIVTRMVVAAMFVGATGLAQAEEAGQTTRKQIEDTTPPPSLQPFPQPQMPPSPSPSLLPFWDHNGSSMRLEASGTSRKFIYETPRPGLAQRGVARGTVVFEGRRAGNTYSGTAFVFTTCGPRSYAVSGPVSEDDRQVTMYGKAPKLDSSCRVTSYTDDTLVFVYQGE